MKFNFKKAAMQVAGTAGGAILAKAANKPMANVDPRLRAGLKIAAGVLLPGFVKNELATHAGNGMIAIGSVELLEAFVPSLAGIGNDDIGAIEEDFAVHGDNDYTPKVYGTEPAVV